MYKTNKKYCFSETGHDPAVHGARLEDRFYNNDSFKVRYCLKNQLSQIVNK